MSDDQQQPAEPTERSVALPAFRRIWLAPMPRRPEPEDEDQEPEVPADE